MTAAPETPDAPPAVSALEMARDWADRVSAIALHYAARDREEPGIGGIEAHIAGAGKAQFEAAQMASYMATVSIAEDLHRIVGIMTGEGIGRVAGDGEGLDPGGET